MKTKPELKSNLRDTIYAETLKLIMLSRFVKSDSFIGLMGS